MEGLHADKHNLTDAVFFLLTNFINNTKLLASLALHSCANETDIFHFNLFSISHLSLCNFAKLLQICGIQRLLPPSEYLTAKYDVIYNLT